MRTAFLLLLVSLPGCIGNPFDYDDNPQPTGVCGDGDYDNQFESCDDGNLVDGDGCNSLCRRELYVRASWSFIGLPPNECPAGYDRAQLRLVGAEPDDPSHFFEAPCTDGALGEYLQGKGGSGNYQVSIAMLDANGAELRVSWVETRRVSTDVIMRQFNVP